MAMARLNVRIRSRLFSALLRQEIGFFDKTKTGEITSRLSADTTTVADQVCLCASFHSRRHLPLHAMLLSDMLCHEITCKLTTLLDCAGI